MKYQTKLVVKAVALLAIGAMIWLGMGADAMASRNSGRRDGDRVRVRLANEEREFNQEFSKARSRFNSNLTLTNMLGTAVSGSARIDVNLKNSGLYDTSVRIMVNNAGSMPAKVFEGWLVDNESGFKLSLGGFTAARLNRADLRFRQMLVNFPVYDKIMVTEEAINDTNPNPGTAVLSADIGASFNQFNLKANLNGASQVPAIDSPATGRGRFVINTTDNTLRFDITFSGLGSAETGAHIHGPAGVGENAGVLFTLPAGSPKIGVWNYDQSLEQTILNGQTYVNIHSVNFPNGEIRGQIVPGR